MQKMAKKFCDHKYRSKKYFYDKYVTTQERSKNVLERINENDRKVFIEWYDRATTKVELIIIYFLLLFNHIYAGILYCRKNVQKIRQVEQNKSFVNLQTQ